MTAAGVRHQENGFVLHREYCRSLAESHSLSGLKIPGHSPLYQTVSHLQAWHPCSAPAIGESISALLFLRVHFSLNPGGEKLESKRKHTFICHNFFAASQKTGCYEAPGYFGSSGGREGLHEAAVSSLTIWRDVSKPILEKSTQVQLGRVCAL